MMIIKKLCTKNNCELVIVPHNLTNKFQPFDISINQTAKKFISQYAGRASAQLSNGTSPGDMKVSLKLSILKPLHTKWIVESYQHLKEQKDSITKGFVSAGILEAIESTNTVYTSIENLFMESKPQCLLFCSS